MDWYPSVYACRTHIKETTAFRSTLMNARSVEFENLIKGSLSRSVSDSTELFNEPRNKHRNCHVSVSFSRFWMQDSFGFWIELTWRHGPSSSVGIVTGYGLYGPGIESRWRRDFSHTSRPALGPTQPPVQWVPGLSPGVENGWGVVLTPHPVLVPRSKTRVELYLYSPYGPSWLVKRVKPT
jgi:hypothetical protein